MYLSSLWTQPPYNDRNSLFFLIPPKLKQYQLSSHFDFGVNNQRSLHLQYHDWGETLEQGTGPPTAPWAPQQYGCPLLRVCVHGVCVCVCSLLCVCVCVFIWMGWMQSTNSEYGSPYLVTQQFTFTKLIYAWLRKSYYSRLFFEWGTIQGRFC